MNAYIQKYMSFHMHIYILRMCFLWTHFNKFNISLSKESITFFFFFKWDKIKTKQIKEVDKKLKNFFGGKGSRIKGNSINLWKNVPWLVLQGLEKKLMEWKFTVLVIRILIGVICVILSVRFTMSSEYGNMWLVNIS